MSLLHWLRSLATSLSRKPTRSARRPRRSAPRLEVLEDRIVPSWTAQVSGGVLTFTSNASNDVLTLGVNGAGNVTAAQVAISPSVSLASLTQLNVRGANGLVAGLTLDMRNLPYTRAANLNVDTLKVQSVPNATLTDTALIFAGAGVFSLSGVHHAELDAAGPHGNALDASGFSGVATLVGGPGNDTLLGGGGGAIFAPNGGSDVLDGASGAANTVTQSGDFSYVLHNGFLSYGSSSANFLNVQQVNLSGGASAAASDAFNVTGYTGTATLTAGAGTNTLVCQADANMVLSNTGLSVSTGGTFSLSGTFQNAQLTGGAGNDTLNASAFSGAVTFNSAGGNDILKGGAGDDLFLVGAGSDAIDGGGGFNAISVDQAANMTLTNTSLSVAGVVGTLANIQTATLKAEPGGNWTLDASAFSGPVSLFGSTGNDTLKGGAGNDIISSGGGNDVIDGGGGNNELVVTQDANFTLTDISLVLATSSTITTSSLHSIQNVFLAGGPGNNTFDVSGYSGAGSIFGNGGSDTLVASGAGTLSLTDTSFSRTSGGTLTLDAVQNAVLTATSGGATFNVSGWSGLDTLNGKGSGDRFNVTFKGVGNATTVIADAGLGGNNQLVVTGANGNNVYGLSTGVAALGSGEAAYFSGVQSVTLNTMNGNDAVYIYGKAAGVTATVNGGVGSDSFVVGSSANTLSTFDGTGGGLTLKGGTGSSNALMVNDSGSTVNESFTLTAAQIVRNTTATPFTIAYSAPGAFGGNVVLMTGSGADAVLVNSDVPGGVTGINTGAGNDAVTAAPPSGGPLSLAGLLYVDEGTGSNAVTVNDSAAATGANLNVTANSISDPTRSYTIDYVASNGGTYAAGVIVLLGSANSTIHVFGAAAGALTAINGGGGADTFIVSSSAFTLDGFGGALYLYGGPKANTLIVSEAQAAADAVLVNASAIYSFGHSFGITYSALNGGNFGGGVFLYTGFGNDTIYAQGTLAGGTTSIASGAGNDMFYVGSPTAGLAPFAGALSIDAGSGSNLLYVSEAPSSAADVLNVTSNTITSSMQPFALLYASTGGTFGQGVTVLGGSGNDQITVSSQPPSSPLFVSGGGGNNVVTVVFGAFSGYNSLTIDGGSGGFNYLLLQAPGATFQVFPTSSRSGTLVAKFSGGLTSTVVYSDIDVVFRTA